MSSAEFGNIVVKIKRKRQISSLKSSQLANFCVKQI